MKKILHFINLNKFKIILLIILLLAYVFICSFIYVNNVAFGLKENVFRLHVIANSNNKEDQELKYKIRDNLINYMNTICVDSNSKEETIEIVSTHMKEFTDIANKTILDNGFNYSATVEIGNFEFPTKKYGDISLPAGFYDALEVKIGKASGENWWCVLYPSLCFVDVTNGIVPESSKEELKESLDEEEYAIISDNNNTTINFKFKLIEFFAKNKLVIANK